MKKEEAIKKEQIANSYIDISIFILSTKNYVIEGFLTFGEAYDAMLRAERVEDRKVQITEVTGLFEGAIYPTSTRRYKYHITDLSNYLTTTYCITKLSIYHTKE